MNKKKIKNAHISFRINASFKEEALISPFSLEEIFMVGLKVLRDSFVSSQDFRKYLEISEELNAKNEELIQLNKRIFFLKGELGQLKEEISKLMEDKHILGSKLESKFESKFKNKIKVSNIEDILDYNKSQKMDLVIHNLLERYVKSVYYGDIDSFLEREKYNLGEICSNNRFEYEEFMSKLKNQLREV